MLTLKQDILHTIHLAQNQPLQKEILNSNDQLDSKGYKNELLLFIKPELTLPSESIRFEPILDLVFNKISDFNIEIKQTQVLGASYLEKNNVMAKHYGVINKISNSPQSNLSDASKAKFEAEYNISINDPNVLGSFEFLKKHPDVTPEGLDQIWSGGKVSKFAGGTYATKVKYNDEDIYLFNGFHPKQLEHFIQSGRSIVAFQVVSNTDWSVLRNDFIGVTDPAQATPGSLRAELLKNKDVMGVSDVSQGSNGFHLSAGPVEGLAELIRFFNNSDQSPQSLSQFSLGSMLLNNFPLDQVDGILNDAKVKHNDINTTAFELTEEKNAAEAISLLSNSTVGLHL